jgi:outer membrane receptor protein involved in Fe transport
MQFSQSVNKSIPFGPGIVPGGGKSDMYPYAQLADADGNPLAVLKDYRSLYTDTAGNGKLLNWKYRPLEEIRMADKTITNQFLRLSIGASWRFRDWLVADLRYQYSSTNNENRDHNSQDAYFTRDLINRFTSIQGNTVTRNIPAGGILDMYNSRATTHNLRGQVNARKIFSGIHDLSFMIAGEIGESKSRWSRTRLYGYQDEYSSWSNNTDYNKIFPSYGNVAGSFRIPFNNGEGNGTLSRFISLLANASYTLLGKYTLYASGRRDGANVFGVRTNNKWKPLWSAGASWDISRESFFRINWITSLKLRTALGYMGNVSLGRSGLPSIRFTTSAPYTGLPTAVPGDAPNPDLRWEEVKTINIGLDFSLLKGRLSGSLEWYRKNSNYLIAPTPIDPTSGVSRYVVNTASLRGNGWELNLNSVNTNGALVWETGFSLSSNKTTVKKHYNIAGNYTIANFLQPDINPVEGRIAWGIASFKWAGLDPETGDPRGFLNKEISKDYAALAMDSVQNQVFHGSSIPLYAGFFTNTFTWKGISVSANILYKLDYYYRLPTISYSDLFNSWTTNRDYAKRWQNPGDEQKTTVPSMKYPDDLDRDNFYAYSEVNVRRGDNIRLQDLRVAYQWQRKDRQRLPVSRAQVYVYVNNLNIFLWKKSGGDLDPDMPANFFPLQRTYTLGVTLNF